MFEVALRFDQDLGGWDVRNVRTFKNMFNSMTLSTENYNTLLIGWDNSPWNAPGNTFLGAGESQYCQGLDARLSLMSKGRIIEDGGFDRN